MSTHSVKDGAMSVKDPLIDTEPNYTKTTPLATPAMDSPDPSIDTNLTHPTSWSRLPLKERHWIIFGIVAGVIVVAVAVTLSVILTRKHNSHATRPQHKYICIPHKDTHVCVVDDVSGNCKNANCCQFNCDKNNKNCTPVCTGTFASANECAQNCHPDNVEKKYGCVGGTCKETTSASHLYINDPCCGSPCPGCNLAPPSKISVLKQSLFQNPTLYLNFGRRIGAGILGPTAGKLRLLASAEDGPNYVGVLFDATMDASTHELTFTAVPQVDMTTACPLTGRQAFVGQNGSSAGLILTNLGDGCTNMYMGFIDGTFTNPQNKPLYTQPIVSQTADTEYLFFNFQEKLYIQRNSDEPQNPGFPLGSLADPTAMASGTADSQARTLFCFVGTAIASKVAFATYTLDDQAWTYTINPFTNGNAPSGVTNFGNLVACSNNGEILLVAGSNEFTMYRLNNRADPYSKWTWDLETLTPVDNINNLAVSYDGKLVAYTVRNMDYVAVFRTTAGSLSSPKLLTAKSATTPLGIGGLQIISMGGTTYVVLATSSTDIYSNEYVCYWVVEDQG